ncbi:Gfo/Idh/MocA family oxidoreductase [Streptomyces erythrochromogenes]|uniref:Gfo/Idh/MocA family oxidoreductase n=1 Tax=Streptomyces erythrochromogenes TaxID=285574 RepID=UPI0036CBD218
MKNFLVVGVGPHARRNHLPMLSAGRAAGLVGTVIGVDLPHTADDIAAFNATADGTQLPVTVIAPFDPACRTLPAAVRDTLDGLVREHAIDAVVISTEPAFHMVYTHWALDRSLSVLLDKPLSVHVNCSVDPFQAAAILTDFDEVLGRYEAVRRVHPEVLVAVQCQRRHHPAFLRMRELISEVTDETNCPVTSVQSFHSDGQWRMPNELIDISYHSFDQGYGKCAHSGYHFFDIVPWLLRAGESPGKELDSVEVHANFSRPGDFLAQLDLDDYARLFPEFEAGNPYTQKQLLTATEAFGEVDAFVSTVYKSGGRTMTLGSINLVHNGFSQRGRFTPARANLYKGNGRVRQESHILQQGPFQAIHFHSLQTLGRDDEDGDAYGIGSQGHIELHVFRNSGFNSRWKKHETLDYDALTTTSASGLEEPTQSSSRRRAMQEFLEYVNGRRSRKEMSSELVDHRRGSTLMAGAYLSAAQQWVGGPPVAQLDFRPQNDGARHPDAGRGSGSAPDLMDVSL